MGRLSLPTPLRISMESIDFKNVSLRNFLSYGNATTIMDLSKPGTTAIVGVDLDNTHNGLSANGSGKSSLVQAIIYALYGRGISDIAVDNLINNVNKKNMEVSVDFKKGKMCYRVVRARKMRSGPSGNYIRFYSKEGDFEFDDSHDSSKGHHARDTDRDIELVLGMSFDLFVRIVVFSAMNDSFFKLPTRIHGTSKRANQTDFIEELFGLTEISNKAEALKVEISQAEKSAAELTTKIAYDEREHKRHNELVESTKNRINAFETSKVKQLKDLEAKIVEYSNIDVEMELNLHEQAAELKTKLNTLVSERRPLYSVVKTALNSIKTAEEHIAHLEDSTCPYCSQEFHDTQSKLEECNATIAESSAVIDSSEERLTQLTEEIEKVELEVEDTTNKITVKSVKTLNSMSSTIQSTTDEIERVTSSDNPYIELMDELQEVELDEIDYTDLNALTQLIDHQKFLMKLLTKRDSFVRKALLTKNLPYLNIRLAENLTQLGLTHKVEFTHELTAMITQFGRELDFGNLSNGQQARVNIALNFAFRDVLQAMHSPINICLLDEVIDVGLDGVGVQAAARMIRQKTKDDKLTMFIISHREEIDGMFDRTLTVQMSEGFSSILQPD